MTRRRDFYPLRLMATAASFTLFGVGGIVLGYVVFPLVSLLSPSPQVATRRCRKLVQLSFRGFIGFMVGLGILTWEISGRDKLARPGQLVVANHPSLIDIVFLISMIDNATCIVKPQLFRNIFTRGPVSRAGYIPSDAPETLIDNCVQAMEEGATLVIFPEGTRTVPGSPFRFRRGAAYVQQRSGCDVVLAGISSSPPMLGKHEKWYEIPHRRAHYTLSVTEDSVTSGTAGHNGTAISPRAQTRQWRDYFVNEVVI